METPEQRAQRIVRHDKYLIAHEQANTALYLASVALQTSPTTSSLQQLLQRFDAQLQVLEQFDKPLQALMMRLQLVFKLQSEQQRSDVEADYVFECAMACDAAELAARDACTQQGNNIAPMFRRSRVERKEGWHSRKGM